MSDLRSLINKLYENDGAAISLEKTAEDRLTAALRGDGQVGENPFDGMSDEDLQKIAADLAAKDTGKAATTETPEVLEKTAAEMLGGQIMAHAMVHELGLIKTAMLDGKCRVCKDHERDVQGSSICSVCLSAAEQ
jgi:hypothetical protein